MPIPPFDSIKNVLPPHLGNPTQPSDLSPYPCTVAELSSRFATSAKRKQILMGFLELRAILFSLGIRGFQWLSGSFLENIEVLERRDPGDIDVVTFVDCQESPEAWYSFIVSAGKEEILDFSWTKENYFVDHYVIPLSSGPAEIVDLTRYWYGLFSHRRDLLWKGMLVVDLADIADDEAARALLAGAP
jgi:hypothetical protein